MSITFKQQGFSLVSILVGLLMGLFSVLAALSLYRIQAQQASVTQFAARTMESQSVSLQMVELEIHNAGFGIPNATATAAKDFALLNNATLQSSPNGVKPSGDLVAVTTTAAAGNAVIWRWQANPANPATVRCAALIADTATRTLFYLESSTCQLGTNLTQFNWPTNARRVIVPSQVSLSVSFQTRLTNCSPYGAGTPSPGLLLTVSALPDTSADNSPWNTERNANAISAENLQVSNEFCLNGIAS
jgi:Tfp pilus assembly protein PilW